MIGHSVKGKGFRGCLNYNLNPAKEAEVIGGNMAGQTPRDLAAEFGQVRQLNQRVKSPCWHVSLSAVPGEKLSNDQWNEVADRYLDQMKLDRSQHQYVVIRHYDTKHQHVHIVANRIDYDGQANYLKWHKKDTKKATRHLEHQLDYLQQTCKQTEQQRAKLEQNYQLPDAESKRGVIQGQYWRVQREQDPDPIQQQKLQGVIDEVLPQSANPDDFRQRLAARGVEMRLRLDEAEHPMGISYQLDGVALPGFALGQSYTWATVQERLQLQQQVQIAPNISQETVQKSLLPGVIDDSEPNARRQRRKLAADGSEHAIGGDQPEVEQDPVAVGKDRGENRAYPPDGIRAVAPTAGSGIGDAGFGNIEDFARRFRDLENLFDGLGQETASARRVESESERDWPSFSPRAGNDSVSAPDLGAFDSDDSRVIESEQGVERSSESLGDSAAGADPIERSAIEPDSAGYPQIDDSSQPDPDVVERETVESKDIGIGGSRIDSSFSVGERSRVSDDSEFITEADFGSDQWASEQSGDQSEKDAQSIEIDPSWQRLIVIANDLSDDALIGVQQEMERYFKQAPKRPDYAQVRRYQDQLKRLTTD